jgi:hypothetical protein
VVAEDLRLASDRSSGHGETALLVDDGDGVVVLGRVVDEHPTVVGEEEGVEESAEEGGWEGGEAGDGGVTGTGSEAFGLREKTESAG